MDSARDTGKVPARGADAPEDGAPRDRGRVIAPEGIPFVAGALAVAAFLALLWPRSGPVTAVAVVAALFLGWFFRDPARTPKAEPGAVISPADGKIVYSGECPPSIYIAGAGRKVSVFMSVFDVHVNRAPVSGRVAAVRYNPGKFHVASVDKASLENEQNGVVIETPGGDRVAFVQIAGIVARRIVCGLREGDPVRRGERIGMIRFGSRVDILLPPSAELRVRAGDRVRAGESVVAVLR